MGLETIAEAVWSTFMNNPSICILVAFLLLQFYQRMQPFPHDDSWRITSVRSLEEWRALKESCATSGKVRRCCSWCCSWRCLWRCSSCRRS